MAAELRFRAMGSDAHLLVVGGHPSLSEQGRRRIDDLERRWSRFVPDSEVSRLTRNAGTPVTVSEDTVALVRRAIEAWYLTGGSFDPTVLEAVVRAGYDRPFEDLAAPPTTPSDAGPDAPGSTVAAWSPLLAGCVDIDVAGTAVRLPAGLGFDPGGIGKGLAADLVAGELLAAGAEGVLVNLGGDLRVTGSSPTGDGWTLDVEHPAASAPLARIGLVDGGVATSTTLLRRWTLDGVERQHLIDPVTAEPTTSDLVLATVVAAEAWQAEVAGQVRPPPGRRPPLRPDRRRGGRGAGGHRRRPGAHLRGLRRLPRRHPGQGGRPMTQLAWYVARSSGIVAWALLAAGVLWGLLLSTKAKAFGAKPRPNWTLDLHRFLGGAGVAFVGVHVVAILLDTYTHFGLADVLVPFASSWHPVAVAWGIVGFYLLLAVEITSLLRKRLSKRAWRLTHLLSFPLYVTATTHAFSAGTDAGSRIFQALAVTVSLLIVALTARRIAQARRRSLAGGGSGTGDRVPTRPRTPTGGRNPAGARLPAAARDRIPAAARTRIAAARPVAPIEAPAPERRPDRVPVGAGR